MMQCRKSPPFLPPIALYSRTYCVHPKKRSALRINRYLSSWKKHVCCEWATEPSPYVSVTWGYQSVSQSFFIPCTASTRTRYAQRAIAFLIYTQIPSRQLANLFYILFFFLLISSCLSSSLFVKINNRKRHKQQRRERRVAIATQSVHYVSSTNTIWRVFFLLDKNRRWSKWNGFITPNNCAAPIISESMMYETKASGQVWFSKLLHIVCIKWWIFRAHRIVKCIGVLCNNILKIYLNCFDVGTCLDRLDRAIVFESKRFDRHRGHFCVQQCWIRSAAKWYMPRMVQMMVV